MVTCAFASDVQLVHAPPPPTVPCTIPTPSKPAPVASTSTCNAIFTASAALISAFKMTVDSLVDPMCAMTVVPFDLYCLGAVIFGSFGVVEGTVKAFVLETYEVFEVTLVGCDPTAIPAGTCTQISEAVQACAFPLQGTPPEFMKSVSSA